MNTPYIPKHLHCTVMAVLIAGAIPCTYGAEIAVIVNPASGFANLDGDKVMQLFMGKANALPNGHIAAPVNQPSGPLRTDFDQKALHKNESELRAYWAKVQFTGKAVPPRELATDDDVKKFVASTPGAIGYIDKVHVDGSVKMVASY